MSRTKNDGKSKGRKIPSYLRKFLSIGPGGPGCTCCFDAPGKRKEKIRAAKRKERREALTDDDLYIWDTFGGD